MTRISADAVYVTRMGIGLADCVGRDVGVCVCVCVCKRDSLARIVLADCVETTSRSTSHVCIGLLTFEAYTSRSTCRYA